MTSTGAAERLWRRPEPRTSYEVVIVGGGLHGLAAAYYLATEHGITDVAVVERAWLGSGNAVRNTTIIRSNYLRNESAALYEFALRLWEGWSDELGWDLLFDQRGVLTLAHSEHEVREAVRLVNANLLNGIDGEWLELPEVHAHCPILNVSQDVRHPVLGAALQRRAGIARHDAVVFALVRALDAAGVHLLQQCPVQAVEVLRGRAVGVTTPRGRIGAGKVALCAAGRSSVVAATAGVDLPIQSRPLQALVSGLLEPVLDCVVTSAALHVYVSQAHKGELVMGAGLDGYASYAQRGSPHVIEQQLAAAVELFPLFASAPLLRTWAGIVDTSPDASPIVGLTEIDGLYVNCGWGTGGFKATPGAGVMFAWTIAHDAPHELAAPFSLERFVSGRLVDEHGATGIVH